MWFSVVFGFLVDVGGNFKLVDSGRFFRFWFGV